MAIYSRITVRWGLDVLWQSLEIVSEFFKLCVRHVFLSGCCHEHHLVPPDPQSSARRNSPSDGAPSVRRVHSICFIYRLGTTLTQDDLKFRLRRHSSYLLIFLD